MQLLGRDLSKRQGKQDDFSSCEHADGGQPARKQRLSLSFLPGPARHACMSVSACTSEKLEGKEENQTGGGNDTTGGLHFFSKEERDILRL